MLAISVVLIALALVGHGAFWIGVVNRWHATGFPRRLVKGVTLLFYAALLVIPLAIARFAATVDVTSAQDADWLHRLNWATAYIGFCVVYAAVHVPSWAIGRFSSHGLPRGVHLRRGKIVNVAAAVGASPARGLWARSLSALPFNQLWHLDVGQFEIELPRLAAELDGLSICHLSDLHYSGRIDRAYFDEVMRHAGEMQADLILLSGDVCDRARCISWIPETLGCLEARLGKYFVLGNHDLRTRQIDRLRGTLVENGFVDLGGKHVVIDGGRIALAGDERPWFKHEPPAAALPEAAFKILLAHTPDRLQWARVQGFDLLCAGHTHGGQVRFPLIGPVVCPSWHGTRYASGFFREPPTFMHVSRGAAGMFPYRLNCRPELSKLVLRHPHTRGA